MFLLPYTSGHRGPIRRLAARVMAAVRRLFRR